VTVLEEAYPSPEAAAAAPTRVTTAALSRRSLQAAALVRVGAVVLPVALVLNPFELTQGLLVAWALVAGIWLLAFTAAPRVVPVSQHAIGGLAVGAVGTLVGLATISAAGFWAPWLHVAPAHLAIVAIAVFATSTVCDRIVRKFIQPRRRLLVVGSSPEATQLVDELAQSEDVGFECVGIVDHPARGRSNGHRGSAHGQSRASALTDAVLRDRPDLVVLVDEPRADDVDDLLDAGSLGFRVVGLPTFYEHAFGRVPVHTLGPLWFMSVLDLDQRPYSALTKRIFDIAVAALALVVLAPLMLLVAGLISVFDRGPVLFRQMRLGEGGRTFEILKFRTMVVDAEQQGRARWAVDNDPRVTRVGRVLRKTRLDELPQLWNVLRGEMSVVGPRPERPEFMEELSEEVPFWTRRHLLKPGITGWAQVRHHYTSDVTGTAEKLGYDLYYLKHRSLFLDLAIVLKTARTVVSGSGAR
jgi:exopolysaccharide biosynthesis polyprenyl glycosylphosphotransferase